MTCVVVNDASAIFDLRKVGLLHPFLTLPYRFVIPLTVRYNELLDVDDAEWARLEEAGLEVFDVPPEGVRSVEALRAHHSLLSTNDCMCLVTARDFFTDSLVLTGDGQMRRAAERLSIRVHGVLWAIDQLAEAQRCSTATLRRALSQWRDDPLVWLPPDEIDARLRSYSD